MSDDKPLLLTEIAAWARAWLDTHERHRALGAELVGEEKIDLDIRAMRQVAETFERLCIVTGGRSLASDASGQVHLPAEHIRRAIANEVAVQLAPMLRITEEWDGVNRRRNYAASIMIVLPKEITQ